VLIPFVLEIPEVEEKGGQRAVSRLLGNHGDERAVRRLGLSWLTFRECQTRCPHIPNLSFNELQSMSSSGDLQNYCALAADLYWLRRENRARCRLNSPSCASGTLSMGREAENGYMSSLPNCVMIDLNSGREINTIVQ